MTEHIKDKRTVFGIKDLVFMAAGAAITAVCSWISIPSAVPFTLQTFAVFCILGMLGGRRGTVSLIVYILLGMVGVPVFSGFKGGIGVIIGTTGGYIVGFIFMGLIYWLAQIIFKDRLLSQRPTFKNITLQAAVLLTGLLVCYAFGTAWFVVAYAAQSGTIGFAAALLKCVVPFIIPDLIKLSAALFVTTRLRRFII